MLRITSDEIFISFLIWFVSFLAYKSALKVPHRKNDRYDLFFILISLFSTFAFATGDYLHYYELYENLYKGASRFSVEEFYYNLVFSLPHSYHLWRFVIWGASSVFLILTFKRLKSPVRLSSLYFVLVLISGFSNLRNTLGLEMMFYSLTFFLVPLKSKIKSYMIGTIGLLVCTYFHKSMPLYLLISLLAFIPLNKKIYKILLLAFPFLYGMFRSISSFVLNLDLGGGAFETVGSNYLEGENFASSNLNGYLSLFINRLPILFLIYYIVKNIISGHIHNSIAKYFIQYSFILIYISFLLFEQPTSSFLSPRFWDASLYALVFALPLALYKNYTMYIKICFWMLLASNMYSFLYSFYKV